MQIVEFGDYYCPACIRVHDALTQLEKEKHIQVDFKNLPLTRIHPDAMVAAEVAECARLQGKFHEMQDLLFHNQDHIDDEQAVTLAQLAGLDIERFKRDMSSGAGIDRIRHDMNEARQLDVIGTPSLYIDGKLFQGDATYESLSQALKPKSHH